MSPTKAALILDPERRAEQVAYVAERAEILHEAGGQLWVSMAEEQVGRFGEHGIAVQLHEEADLISLPALTFDPGIKVPEPPQNLSIAPQPQGTNGYYLVQFIAPAHVAWIHEILRLGGSHVQDLPVNVVLFRLTAVRAEQTRQLEYVRWVGLYHPAYALNYVLAGRTEPFTATSLRELAVDPESLPSDDGSSILVRLFEDLSIDDVREAVETAGVAILEDTGYGGFVVDADAGSLSRLLRVDGVFAVEIDYPVALANNRAGVITGVNQVRNFRNVDFLVNLDGSGEIVGVMDFGLGAGTVAGNHPDLAGRILRIGNLTNPGNSVPDAYTNPPDPRNTWHGTHVTGTIAGDGASSSGRVRGVAPASHVVFHGPVTPATITAANFLRAFVSAHNAGARVHNNSWGSFNAVTNNLYSGVADDIDKFCFTHPESLVVFAAHNHEQDTQPAPDGNLDMNRLSFHSLAKNILTVGAVESRRNDGFQNDYNAFTGGWYSHANLLPLATGIVGAYTMSDDPDQVALFSNRGVVNTTIGGTVSTGRVKPDLVAPGTNILSLRSSLAPPPTPSVGRFPGWMDPRPATADPAFYGIMSGTSMATPQVSGAALLIRQFYRSRFGQMRRPLLLETPTAFVDPPSIAPHRDGRVVAWVSPKAAAGPNHIVAARYTRDWKRLGDIVKLQENVGAHPAPALTRHGDNTLLVHRANDNTIKLSLYDRALAPVSSFGNGGTVTLAPASGPEDSRRPGHCVRGDEIAVAWNEGGGDRLLFRRYRADNGNPVDDAPKNLGDLSHSSSHPFVTHNGTNYAVLWAREEGGDHKLRLRLIDGSGTPQGAQPITLATQNQGIRDPHLIWDPRQNRFVVVWAGSSTNPAEDLCLLFADPAGTTVGAPSTATTVATGNTARRPRIAVHPDAGYVLLWEDDTQKYRDHAGTFHNRYDVYAAFLDDAGRPDRLPEDLTDPPITTPVARPSRNLLRISDTPEDTAGFTAITDADGAAIVWQSNDETNSDRLGVYGLNVTPLGAFAAQVDPNAPMIDSGRYKNHTLLDYESKESGSVSIAWASGDYYLLRTGPEDVFENVQLLRTNTDGLVDETYGTGGVLPLAPGWFLLSRHEMHWTEERLICVSVGDSAGPDVFLLDSEGKPVKEFGERGWQSTIEGGATNPEISPQLGHVGKADKADFRIIVVYGTGSLRADIKYMVLNKSGGYYVPPLDLARADGTARHGWFHYVGSESRSIAAWHRVDGGSKAVFLNRYTIQGSAQYTRTIAGVRRPDDLKLSAPPGDSMNAVISPRPVAIDSGQREYGIAWQHRADNSKPWEILFSRLDRDAKPMANTPVPHPPAPGGTQNVRVISPSPGVWPPPGWPTTDAIEPQLASTYTHQDWNKTLLWSPGYGLAWLARYEPGGDRTLFFTVLDENGARARLPLPPPYEKGDPRTEPARIVQVSGSGSDVRDFKLIWNGRTFRLTWTEAKNGRVRHMQTALTRHGSREIFDQPSSALLRATLINGATNIRRSSLPNIPSPPITNNNRNHGYGWGRVNLRQSLSPMQPVTFHVRDDAALWSGRPARYRFDLPPGTRLLRATLAWTDPPRNDGMIVNNLHLRIIPPGGEAAGQEYHGNTWSAGNKAHLSRLVARGAGFDPVHTVEQIVLQASPADDLAGTYYVEVIAQPLPNRIFNQFRTQPFALVFVGSGEEMRFGGVPPAARVPVY